MSTGAVDCHAHIFCRDRPFAAERTYDPEPGQIGTIGRFLSVLDAHGLSHALVVAAEPYGADNACMLEGIAASAGRLKGIALVKPDIGASALARLAAAGVVGIRFNLTSFGMRQFTDPAAEGLLSRLHEMGWFLQIHCEKDELVQAMPVLRKARVRTMIDHFGRPDVTRGLTQPGFRALLELGRSGNAVVKLSGAFRCSRQGPLYADAEPFIAAAIDAFGLENCVWGSDWPFVRVSERLDYGPELACLARWLPDPADRRKVLWDNPVRLFGFA